MSPQEVRAGFIEGVESRCREHLEDSKGKSHLRLGAGLSIGDGDLVHMSS